VTKLGGFGTYTALHVRRNELQYKEVFISADQVRRDAVVCYKEVFVSAAYVRCSLVQIR
jgi:hypothetical protein